MRHSAMLLAAGAALALIATGAQAQPTPPRNDAAFPPVTAVTMMASSVPCSDLKRSIAFYTRGLGMTLGGPVEMGNISEALLMLFPGGGTYLMLQRPKSEGMLVEPRGPLSRIILVVPDLKGLVARLNAERYQIKGGINENAQYRVLIAQLEDPDGNHIELVQRLP